MRENVAPSTLRRRNLKTEVSLWKRIKFFPSTLRRRNLKTQQSQAFLQAGKSHDYHKVIVFKEFRF